MSYAVTVKSTVEILQYFVAFSEYMDFKKSPLQNFVRRTLNQEAKEKINSGCIEGVISTFFEPATTFFKYFFITHDITMFSITSEK